MTETVELSCQQCGSSFSRRAAHERYRQKKGQAGPFCSRSCQVEWRTGREMIDLTCKECGSGFQREKRQERFRQSREQDGPYCSTDCMYIAQRTDPVESFMEKWEYDEGCWRWTAATGNQGHGRFWDSGELVQAHRFAFEEFYGREIIEGLEIHHTCENPGCVYPLHLMEVTHKEHANLHA